MKPPSIDVPRLFMKPGQLVFSSQPVQVTTILGSCVAVTMYYPPRRIGAICHCLLPRGEAGEALTQGLNNGFKFVDGAMKAMLRAFQKHDIGPKELVFKVFGGGDVYDDPAGLPVTNSVGMMNVNEVNRVFFDLGIYPMVEEIRGEKGRKIIFFSHTGEVFVKRLNRMDEHAD